VDSNVYQFVGGYCVEGDNKWLIDK
jgi:hypothetical protein